jgi:hypothetical protein
MGICCTTRDPLSPNPFVTAKPALNLERTEAEVFAEEE